MTVSKEIIEVLDYFGQKFGIAIDWSSENVIPYIQELSEKFVNYKVISDIFYIIMLLICTMILIPITIKMHKRNGDLFVVFFVVTVGVIGILVVMAPLLGSEIIKCLTFPELAILDYLKGLNI